MKKEFIIDFELLKKIVENDYNCLCKLNTKCPCSEFINEQDCHCGVYKKSK